MTNFRLDEDERELLVKAGGGNKTKGLRILLKALKAEGLRNFKKRIRDGRVRESI